MTDDISEKFADWQAYIASDLERFLVSHTGLANDHPYVRLGMNAAMKHVGYCAADFSVEEKESVLYTKEQAFLQTYAEHAADFYTAYMEAKHEMGSHELTERDLYEMESVLKDFSSGAFRKARHITDAVKAGEMEAWEPPKPEIVPPYLNKDYLKPHWHSTNDQHLALKIKFVNHSDTLSEAEKYAKECWEEPEPKAAEHRYLGQKVEKPSHTADVTNAQIKRLTYHNMPRSK